MKHQVRSCPSKFKCKIEGCGLSHHTLLHKLKLPVKKKDDIPNARNNTTTLETSGAVLLQVVPVRVIGHHGAATTTSAMLDSGLEITLVDPSLMEQLGVQGRSDKLLAPTVSDENDLQHGHRLNSSIESLIDETPEQLKLINAWCSKEL